MKKTKSLGEDLMLLQMFRTCIICRNVIPLERLLALPETETCVECSKEKKYISTVHGTGSGKGYVLEYYKADNKLAKNYINLRKRRTW
jgi:hypothetical protein